jgi:hypothetical protein
MASKSLLAKARIKPVIGSALAASLWAQPAFSTNHGSGTSASALNAAVLDGYSYCTDGNPTNWVINLHEQWDANLIGYEHKVTGYSSLPVGGIFIFGRTENNLTEVSAVYQAAYRSSIDEYTFDYLEVTSPEEGNIPLSSVRWWSDTEILMVDDGYSTPRALNCEYRTDVNFVVDLLAQFEKRIGLASTAGTREAVSLN